MKTWLLIPLLCLPSFAQSGDSSVAPTGSGAIIANAISGRISAAEGSDERIADALEHTTVRTEALTSSEVAELASARKAAEDAEQFLQQTEDDIRRAHGQSDMDLDASACISGLPLQSVDFTPDGKGVLVMTLIMQCPDSSSSITY
jgi:hypothetical protein